MSKSLLVATLCAVAASCHLVRPETMDRDQLPSGGRFIGADEIAESDARTAWEVVERTGIFRMGSDGPGGRVLIRSRRGRSSIVLHDADTPKLVVNGALVADPRYLRDIPAMSIAYVHIVGGIAGGAAEGMNSGGGVIYVVSKAGP